MGLSTVMMGSKASCAVQGVAGCARAKVGGRERSAACSAVKVNKVSAHLPCTFQRQRQPASRQGRSLLLVRAAIGPRGNSNGDATNPSSAARLVKDDTAAALARQLEQSTEREQLLEEAGPVRGTPVGGMREEEGKEQHEGGEAGSSDGDDLEQELAQLKLALLSRVAGLDRGVATGERERIAVDDAASALESAGPGLDLPGDLDKMDGKWRLVYTSSFSSGSVGGARPGPPFLGANFKLGQVYQRIDVLRRELDNIVDLQIQSPVPLLPPGLVTATLAHSFEVTGPSDIRITFEDTRVQPRGLQLPEFTLPSLPDFLRSGTKSVRSSTFATTFVDDQLRITRGDRKELRIFVKEKSPVRL